MPPGGRPGPNQPEFVLTQRGSFRTAAVRRGFVVLSRDGFVEVSLYLLKAASKAIWGTVPEIYFDGREKSSPILLLNWWLIPPRADARECRQQIQVGKS